MELTGDALCRLCEPEGMRKKGVGEVLNVKQIMNWFHVFNVFQYKYKHTCYKSFTTGIS